MFGMFPAPLVSVQIRGFSPYPTFIIDTFLHHLLHSVLLRRHLIPKFQSSSTQCICLWHSSQILGCLCERPSLCGLMAPAALWWPVSMACLPFALFTATIMAFITPTATWAISCFMVPHLLSVFSPLLYFECLCLPVFHFYHHVLLLVLHVIILMAIMTADLLLMLIYPK